MRDAFRRFLPAFLLAALSLASAPFLGLVRDAMFDRLGAAAVKILALSLLILGVIVFVAAASRIRDRRAVRFGLLAVVLGLLAAQTVLFGTGLAQVDVVEKVHIVQYGLLAALFYRALALTGQKLDLATLLLPCLWAGLVGVAEESVQAFFRLRVGDVRDVGLNLLAGLCGLLFALALAPPTSIRHASVRQDSNDLDSNALDWSDLDWNDLGSWRTLNDAPWRRTAAWAAALVLAAGLFFDQVHLGHWIEDRELGRFRSWFTAEQLGRLSQDRQRLWAESPPGEAPWLKKDYYLVEAASHANFRNASYQNGQWSQAWHANLILERYYAPFLDVPSFHQAGPHRYPPALRSELAERAAKEPLVLSTPVQGDRVFAWSRGLFWLAVLSAARVVYRFLSLLDRRADSAPR